MDKRTSPLHILIVDDDPDDQMLMTEAFQSVNRNVVIHCVNNGNELLGWLNTNTCPDLITLDLNMPIIDGFGALANLKSSNAHHHIPVFMLSTSSVLDDKFAAKKLGAEDFFIKPSTFSSLKIIVRQIYYRSIALIAPGS